jgi:hypothetical protein
LSGSQAWTSLKSHLQVIEFGQQRHGRFDGPRLPVADQHDVCVINTVHELDRGSGDTAERDIEIDLRRKVRYQFVHAEANGFFGGHEGSSPDGTITVVQSVLLSRRP